MAKTYHCWRCNIPVPMLTKEEWKQVGPLLRMDEERTKASRTEIGIGLKDALDELQSEACEKYYELTGFRESHWQSIWHHRLSEHGPECPGCGRLFRTPRASYCANCGYKKSAEQDAPGNCGKELK